MCIADSTGIALSYGKALAGSLALARRLRAALPEPSLVGLLLPASVGGALANIALLMAGWSIFWMARAMRAAGSR